MHAAVLYSFHHPLIICRSPVLFAACWAVAFARVALSMLLLVPFALAIFIAAGVFVLLAGAA